MPTYRHNPGFGHDEAWAAVTVAVAIFAMIGVAAISYGTNTRALRAAKEPQSTATTLAPSTTGRGGDQDERGRPLIVR